MNQESYFGNSRINFKGIQSLEICHFEIWNLSVVSCDQKIKKINDNNNNVFPTTKVERVK